MLFSYTICLLRTVRSNDCQILQTYIAGEDARKFSQYRFKNGEVYKHSTLYLLPYEAFAYNINSLFMYHVVVVGEGYGDTAYARTSDVQIVVSLNHFNK